MFNKQVPFFVPSFSEAEERAVCDVLRSGWITTGTQALAFEKEFAAYVGAPYACAVNSATSGLLLTFDAMGIGPDSKILTSPYTFVSTASSALHLGAQVVYADIERDSYNISAECVEACLKKDARIRAIVPIHIAGNVCNMRDLNALARKYQVAVVEDAAHAFPSKTACGYAGTLSHAGVFSFYATKPLTTGEGGMVCTNDAKLAARIACLRSHGIDRAIWDRYTNGTAPWRYDVTSLGWKCNLPDILAAIGRVQLQKAAHLFAQRARIAAAFTRAFSRYEFFCTPPDGDGNAWHLYLLRLVPGTLSVSRDEFVRLLQERGLGVSMHFIPHFEMTFFKKSLCVRAEDFPECAHKYQHTLTLPLWPGMDDSCVAYVIETVVRTAQECAKGRAYI
ncbi:spore coat polysaccharide biosynthesis protein [Treponema pallidum subsp. pallidum str. Sea 81-4]|uniref:DegT/DnrJ/EryC1/StrS aminotransferase family protein n=1 Tax=Treponema pallidum TaxID=160 RepID=UPI0004375615|nr:DegT/DnrJ/EryC1/StrS aminotransferase family protein [Treponema pallidum]AHN66782.1 spore coat polysaccharide biosynthesis protein [Treponema pallidum subsp. pallidum str. Sea 81-4]